jgi:hypothetical protein
VWVRTPDGDELAGTGLDALRNIRPVIGQVNQLLASQGFDEQHRLPPGREWVERAIEHHLARRHAGLWSHLVEVRSEARRLQEALRARELPSWSNWPVVLRLMRPVTDL